MLRFISGWDLIQICPGINLIIQSNAVKKYVDVNNAFEFNHGYFALDSSINSDNGHYNSNQKYWTQIQ